MFFSSHFSKYLQQMNIRFLSIPILPSPFWIKALRFALSGWLYRLIAMFYRHIWEWAQILSIEITIDESLQLCQERKRLLWQLQRYIFIKIFPKWFCLKENSNKLWYLLSKEGLQSDIQASISENEREFIDENKEKANLSVHFFFVEVISASRAI